MQVKDVVDVLRNEGVWVDWKETRDHLLRGRMDQTICNVGVCWVATLGVLEQAVEQKIDLLITHENPFYVASTHAPEVVVQQARIKEELLDKAHIALYRCHDVWDKMPVAGIADQYAARLALPFIREEHAFLQFAQVDHMCVEDVAKRCAKGLSLDGENGVVIVGDPQASVHRIGAGCGAACNLFDMVLQDIDLAIVSDDAITNYTHLQFAIDRNLPIIIVHHAACEIAGMKAMQDWLRLQFPQLHCSYLEDDFQFTYITHEEASTE